MSETQITVTPAASRKVFELIQEENNPDLMLRIYISGGGCSGFQYGFMFDTEINPDDVVITQSIYPQKEVPEVEMALATTSEAGTPATAEAITAEESEGSGGSGSDRAAVKAGELPIGEVTVLIDAMSYQYLRTAILDYKKDTYGEQFVFKNPQAKTTCGCGSSFSVE